MSILGITNRTENWKTARQFAPYFTSDSARAALAQKLCGSEDHSGKDIQIELFWKGMRDYVHMSEKSEEDHRQYFVDSYMCWFSNLHI